MSRLLSRFTTAILTFAPLFLQRSWRHAEVLLTGAILAPGKRTVASILRITGLAREQRSVNYHRVLNRTVWCPWAASRLLLGLLLGAFVPTGPIVLGIDNTIERRRGKSISAPRPAPPAAASQTDRESDGIYRDPVRSSHGNLEGKRPTLAQPHAPDPDPMGGAHLGAAVPDGARPLGALLPRAPSAA